MTSQNNKTSQLPKPVESVTNKPEDHYLVPPIVISGETETKYQYFSLHDTAKLLDVKKEDKKPNIVRRIFQKVLYTVTNSKRNNYKPFENSESGFSSLQDWHDKTVKTTADNEEQVKNNFDRQDTNL